MASLSLKDVKKIYPYSPGKEQKASKKKEAESSAEEGPKLLRTDKGVVAVHDLNLEIEDKEFIVLVGPSGCGKSTTLRMIAGLEGISEGELCISDKRVNEIPPKDRDIAMVFQNYALYPHMTVYENMAFALKLRKTPKKEIDIMVRDAAEVLGITEYLNRKPKALSGGQRQRVAIGRAIVRKPQVFLMDEPLSNLDAKLRNQMRAELLKLHKRINTTFIYVTHDQTEAMTLGDRIVIMKDGLVQQIGTPNEVFDDPVNKFVAGFIGTPQMNFFDARLVLENGEYTVEMAGKRLELSEAKQERLKANRVEPQEVIMGIRPEHCGLARSGESGIPAAVGVSEMMGSEIYLHVTIGDNDAVLRLQVLNLEEKNKNGFEFGAAVDITIPGQWINLFAKDTELNLLHADNIDMHQEEGDRAKE